MRRTKREALLDALNARIIIPCSYKHDNNANWEDHRIAVEDHEDSAVSTEPITVQMVFARLRMPRSYLLLLDWEE